MTSGNGSAARGLPARPRYFAGQLVRHGDLEAGESHSLARHRRHAMHVHGCGVVCGLLVELETDPAGEQVLVIAPGFAVDGAGNELELGEATSARLGEICYLTGAAEARSTGSWPPDGGDVCALGPLADQRYYLALCHAEATFCPVPAYPDECGGTLRTEPARRRDCPHLVLLDSIGDTDCVRRNLRLGDPDWIESYDLFEPLGEGESPEFPPEPGAELVRAEPVLSRRWSTTEPPADGLRSNHLLVRWRRRVYCNAGRYRFRFVSDGGARLWVADQLVIDDWHPGAARARSGELILPPGVHEIRVEYFHETGAAFVDVVWQPLQTGWHARFYPYPEQEEPPEIPSGEPTATWIEPALAIQLEGSESFPDLPETHFVLRLVRDIEITAPGLHAFTAHTDDGMRIRIDGETVLDEWRTQAPTRYEPRVMLGPGTHRVEVDFFERRGFAVAKLTWRRAGPYNPSCHPPRLPGCVVLAAFDVRAGAIRPETLRNFALDVTHGFERAVLPSAEVLLGRAIAALGSEDPRPALAGILPGRGRPGETVAAVVFGHGVGGASRVRFATAGVTATVLSGGGDDWLPVQITIAADADPGLHAFALDTPWCRVDSSDFNLTFEIESLPLPTISPTIFTPTPTFQPTFFPTVFTAAPSFFTFFPTVFTLAPSLQPTFQPTFFPTVFTAAPSFLTFAPTLFTAAPSVFTVFTGPPTGPSFFSFFSLPPGGGGGPVVSSRFVPTGQPFRPPFAPLATTFVPGGGGILLGPDVLVDPARGEAPIGGLRGLEAEESSGLAVGGLATVGALAESQPDRIVELTGVSPIRALELVELARASISVRPAETAAGNRPVSDVSGVGPALSRRLEQAGIQTVGALALSDPPTVARLLRVSENRALRLLGNARARLFEEPS